MARAITGASDVVFTPTAAEAGRRLSVVVSYTDRQGFAESDGVPAERPRRLRAGRGQPARRHAAGPDAEPRHAAGGDDDSGRRDTDDLVQHVGGRRLLLGRQRRRAVARRARDGARRAPPPAGGDAAVEAESDSARLPGKREARGRPGVAGATARRRPLLAWRTG